MPPRLVLALARLETFKLEHISVMLHASSTGCAECTELALMMHDAYERRN